MLPGGLRASAAAAVLVLVGCGGRVIPVDQPDGGGSVGGGGPSAGGGAGAPPATGGAPPVAGGSGGGPACSFDATLETRPGPCSDKQQECGAGCGSCASGESCFDKRCYDPLGPKSSFPPELMRGLFTDPEGERCLVAADGVLEKVDAALWNSGITAIDMDVYLPCGGKLAKAATVSLPGSAFPAYDGIHGEMRNTTFALHPALRVHAGDTVLVVFHAEGASQYSNAAVSGIYMSNVDPDCNFSGYDSSLGLGPETDWDYMARLYIHK